MTFIIILFAFLLERFFDCSYLRRWQWLLFFQTWLHKRLIKISPYLILAINLVLPLLIVQGINHLLDGHFYHVFKIIFGIIILLYCFGPENFWIYAYRMIAANTDDNKTSPKLILSPVHESEQRRSCGALFIEAQQRVFAVIFWFLVLGPLGAVLYRIIDVSKTKNINPEEANVIQEIHALLDWLPIRIFTLLFALAGHFGNVFAEWKKYFFTALHNNEILLRECGMAAITSNAEKTPENIAQKKEILVLLDRVFVITLVILAMFVLVI